MDLDELNKEQREAVTSSEGFIRVVAGAGSGKTRALTYRFAYLVNEIGVLPSNILCVTFTNKAAAEMRNRIRKLTGDNDTGYISTFHGFCVSVLQEDSNAVQYPKSFLVLDNSDIDSMLQIIYEERGLTLRQMTFSKARDLIENLKLFKHPEYYLDMVNMDLELLYQKYLSSKNVEDIIFYGYLYQEKKCFGLDYNDLLKFVLYIFQKDSEIRQKWQERLEYIMIDEFQDIDFIQYELMKVLCDYHKNLFIVGDPDQTIYSWRGADARYLIDFDKKFPNVKTIMLMTNYRSLPGIIDLSNSLISKNKNRIEKNLIASRKNQSENLPRPLYFHAQSAQEEAEFVAKKIIEYKKDGISAHDIVILYRAHYLSRNLEEVFQQKKIEYTLFSGIPFFERKEIKDSLSYLRMIAYQDDLSFLRIVNCPKRNIGERRINYLKEYVQNNGGSLYQALKLNLEEEIFQNTKAKAFVDLIENYSKNYSKMQISELFSFIMNDSSYEYALRTEGSQERLDNLAELKQSIYEYEISCGEECNLENYLSHAALYTNSDLDSPKDKIRLMSIHAAKGLEFPIVFIIGLNENIFPSKKVDSLAAMEEERRLAFVATTRAKDALYLTDAQGQMQGGASRYPSRFIFDVDRKYLDYLVELPEELYKKSKNYIDSQADFLGKMENLSALEIGDRVGHQILGKGIVSQIDCVKHVYTVIFDNIPTPRKMSFKAPLTKLEE